MGGRPRTEGAKPPGTEGSEAPAKRPKAAKAPAHAATAGKAKAAVPTPADGTTPRKAKAKPTAAAPAPAPAATPARKARATAAGPAAEPGGPVPAPKATAKAKKPAASAPAAEPVAARKAKGADAMALLDALRRAQGKPVTEVAPTGDEPDADDDEVDADADADADTPGEGAAPAAEIVRAPKAPPPFARTSGAPALGFPADKRPAPRWDFAVAKPLTLPLGVRSTGGVGRGVIVELSGAAVSEGLFEASELVHDGTRARFVRDPATGVLRATLADSAIPIGVQVPLSPPPRDEMQRYAARTLLASTHVELSIEGKGSRVGTALLSVAARPATGTAAPLKWTRPITFR